MSDEQTNGEVVAIGLGESIRAEIAAAKNAARSAVEHAVRAGQLLIEAKAQIAHGEWGPWLSANVDVADRTARAYMALTRRWAEMDDPKRQRVADLSLRQALNTGAPQLTRNSSDDEIEERFHDATEDDEFALYDQAYIALRAHTVLARMEKREIIKINREFIRTFLANEDFRLAAIGSTEWPGPLAWPECWIWQLAEETEKGRFLWPEEFPAPSPAKLPEPPERPCQNHPVAPPAPVAGTAAEAEFEGWERDGVLEIPCVYAES